MKLRRFLYVVWCLGGMVAFWFAINWLVLGISKDFGYGFGSGVAVTVILFWLAGRINEQEAVD